MAPRVGYRQPQAGGAGFARTMKVFGGPQFNLVAADVALNAQVAVCRVPKGFNITSMDAVFGACDSGATLSMSIGTAASTALLAATSTTPRAGGTVNLVSTAVGNEFTDDTDILLTSTAAAAGLGATPSVLFRLYGFMR